MTKKSDVKLQLYTYLRDSFEQIHEQVQRCVDDTDSMYSKAFDEYRGLLQPVVQTYQHHQGFSISKEEFEQRFVSETAVLHTVTNLFKKLSGKNNWPLYCTNNLFTWFRYNDPVVDLSGEIPILDARMAIELADHADQLLSQSGQRYLGEFYTPPDLTKHIVDLLCFNPASLYDGALLVDPACGGGNVLAELLLRTLKFYSENDHLYQINELIEVISETVHGYDIQPYAIVLTQTVLQYILLVSLPDSSWLDDLSTPLFPNIELCDPLAKHKRFWLHESSKFTYIVGNPPFMSVKKEGIDHIDNYEEVLSGHPNLYIMFLWWAIQSAKNDGHISFLLPQSLLTGPYFSAIRAQVEQFTRLRSLTRLLDRKGLVGSADQQMMILALEKSTHQKQTHHINVRVVRNGSSITGTNVLQLPYNRVVRQENGNILWQVSNNEIDFEILSCLESVSQRLSELAEFQVGNGSLVWNQHKELIRVKQVRNSLPLISSASIGMYEFVFPYQGSHSTRERPFILAKGEKLLNKRHFSPVLLVKRTTPKKVGRRLLCGIPRQEFFDKYDAFFLENHVNYIKVVNPANHDLLLGLMVWLNSDLVNFVFQLRNGTTQVSVFELNVLPVALDVVIDLIPYGRQLQYSKSDSNRSELAAAVNDHIFNWLNVTQPQITRIKSVLAWTERILHSHD